MTVSVSNITGGPAQFQVDDVQLAHTQGGVTLTAAPAQRQRVVDQYGTSPVDVIHQGDEVRITAPLAEWTLAALAAVYDPGLDELSSNSNDETLGIGRSAGYIYGTYDVKAIPFLAGDAAKKIQVYRAVPVGQIEIAHDNENDRVLNAEFIGTVDTSKDDGALIALIFRN